MEVYPSRWVTETERVIILRGLSLEIEVCKGMCEADSDRTHASLNQWRHS